MSQPKTIHEVLSWASLFLQTNDCEASAGLLLVEHHLEMDRLKLYMHMQADVPEEMQQAIERDVRAHVETGVPVQHLIGSTEFYGRDFVVSKDVLIPRFETEELVEEALRLIRERALGKSGTVVDLGTGSGVIATSISAEYPQMTVYATDVSEAALRIAEKNMQAHEVAVTCLQGNFAAPLIAAGIQVDLLVSNPPYIADAERSSLSRTVRNYDPDLALFAQNDGLAAYETILSQATQVVKPGGMMLFEIGATQGEAVKQIIQHVFPMSEVDVLQDINNRDRIVRALL